MDRNPPRSAWMLYNAFCGGLLTRIYIMESGAETEFPEALEAEIGEIRRTEQECPGVWYVCTGGDGERDRTEFYVVDRDTDSISNEAKAYGAAVPDCPQYLLYPMKYENRPRKIILWKSAAGCVILTQNRTGQEA